MRALRVVGITEGGGECSVVLEDSLRRERFTVPADEQLRAAARGDLTRLGQIAIELESQLRPREIQARIRAGASVEQVAAAAGVPSTKIERFAYPVLLERSRTAEVAQRAHPLRADGPDRRMLGDVVAYTFGLRGQEYQTAEWDSWKGEDGRWVIALSWRAGRSDNRALWAFQPGAHGGTVTAIDEHAHDLVEGLPARPLRTVGPVIDISRPDEPALPPPPEEGHELRAAASDIAARRDVTDWTRPMVEPRRPDSARRGTRPDPTEPPSRPGRGDESAHRSARPQEPADDLRDRAPELEDRVVRADEPATEWPTTAPTPDHRSTTAPTPDHRPTTAQAEDHSPAPEAEHRAAAPAAEHRAANPTVPVPAAPAPAAQGSSPSAAATVAEDTVAPDATVAPAPQSDDSPDVPAAAPAPDAPDHYFAAPPRPAAQENPDRAPVEAGDGRPTTDGTSESETVAPDAPTAAAPEQAAPAATPAPKRTRKGKPVMPSWDEVLLGVRSQR